MVSFASYASTHAKRLIKQYLRLSDWIIIILLQVGSLFSFNRADCATVGRHRRREISTAIAIYDMRSTTRVGGSRLQLVRALAAVCFSSKSSIGPPSLTWPTTDIILLPLCDHNQKIQNGNNVPSRKLNFAQNLFFEYFDVIALLSSCKQKLATILCRGA